ncbi:MAG: DUF308 domain-containing protein [Clostridia bacterium]|nr:DUF308 domain-containing protein [Clostridia bacterium]
MKKFLKNSNSGIMSLLEIILGVLLVLMPDTIISYFMIIAGAILAIFGTISLIKYFVAKPNEAIKGSLTGALVSLSIGVFLIICNARVKGFLDIITLVIGAVILYTGYQKLENAIEKIRKKQFFVVTLVSALITIVVAVLAVFNVINKDIILQFIGVALIVEAVIDLADMIVATVKGKKDEKNDSVIETTAEDNKASSEE